MASSQQPEPKTIAEVLQSVEARQFWERAYLATVSDAAADKAIAAWQERFGPKAAE